MPFSTPTREQWQFPEPGLTTELRQEMQLEDYGTQLLDFRSPFYQQFRSYLRNVTPIRGTHTALATGQAGGGNFGASQAQAAALGDEWEREQTDFLNTATTGFASQSIGQGLGALSTTYQGAQQRAQFYDALDLQSQMFNAGQPDFGDYLMAALPAVGSFALGLGKPGGGGNTPAQPASTPASAPIAPSAPITPGGYNQGYGYNNQNYGFGYNPYYHPYGRP